MDKTEAMALIQEKVPNENLVKHMIAVGVIMEKLAAHLNASPEKWALAGILHDIDLGTTDDPAIHGNLGASWLEEMGLDADICHAVKAHAGHVPCRSMLDTALCAADQMSGLIIACALIKEKKLANVSVDTIRKRFKEKRFAAGADRQEIMKCKELGMELDEFSRIALEAMQTISDQMEL